MLLRNNDFDSAGGGNDMQHPSSIRTPDEMMKELAEDRQTATDTPAALQPETSMEPEESTPEPEQSKPSFFSFAPPPPPVDETPGDDPEPMFPGAPKHEEQETPGTPVDETGKHALSPKKAQRKFDIMFKVRDNLQSRLLAVYADEDDREQFRMDQEDKEILQDYYLQVIEENGGKIPWYIDLLLVEGSVLLPKMQMAKRLKKLNAAVAALREENERLKQSPDVARTIALAPVRERKNFTIDENGFYVNPPDKVKYLKKDLRTERASLKDIQHIVEDNEIAVVMKAFNMTEDQIKGVITNG